MKLNTIINGDSLQTVKTFPDKSIDCVITSPPYFQLRDYGYSEQWGLEPTYQEYLDHLISLMSELKRVLKDEGTMWINLGDSYNGSGKDSGKQGREFSQSIGNIKVGEASPTTATRCKDIPNKCLLNIPHRFAIKCVDELGLIERNDIIWAKRNGMPESVTDRFSKKHEYIFFFVKQQKYYFDLKSIRRPLAESSIQRLSQNIEMQEGSDRVPGKTNGKMKAVCTKIPEENCESYGSPRARNHRHNYLENTQQGGKDTIFSGGQGAIGSNPGSVSDFWDIPTQPSSAKHYATFNSDLIDKPIIAGCPKGGIILDPFCGTGTTLKRAYELDRNFIGIDGSKEYCELARKLIQPTLNQEKLAI